MLWRGVWFWLNRERENKVLMTLEKKTKRQLRQSRIWWTPYPWMDFHLHFLLSGFCYSLTSLYCIYQLGNCCQHRVVYHDAVIDCKVFLSFLCSVISCIFLLRVWGGVSVRGSEPMDCKNWHFWFYWWLFCQKAPHSQNMANTGAKRELYWRSAKRLFLVTPRCHKQR